VALAVALTALACLLNLPTPWLIQRVVDRAAAGEVGALPRFAAALLAVVLSQAGVALAVARAIGPVGLGVVRDLRHRLYDRLQRIEMAYYDRTPAGAILSRLTDDVDAVQALINGQTLAALTDLGTMAVIAAALLARGGGIAAAVVVMVPLHAVAVRLVSRRIRAESDEVRRRLDAIFGRLKETLDGALAVKACAGEESEVAAFSTRLAEAHAPRLRVGRLSAGLSNLGAALGGVGGAAVFAAGAWAVVGGSMSPGQVVATTALAALLFGPAARLADLASLFQQAGASVDRLGDLLDLDADAPDPARPVAIGRPVGKVEFDRVTFGYRPGRPAVADISLTVEPGMKVALVGPTGCGKTTLMNLLLRFYEPTSGEIRLDGVPIGRHAAAELRRQVGVVPQEPVVFRRSLAENIRYGTPEADADRVEAAARAALVHGFATALPDGYATIVGEGGHALSQGERQRLAIARALCKDPALIVLDEATSALDPAGEALIQAALANLLRGRTAFVVAHRLATVTDADLIVVLAGGRVVEAGTHEALLADADGLYRRLHDHQESLAGPVADGRILELPPRFHPDGLVPGRVSA
jgi:subfamily B ATP-binding cassette protein MsbA